MTTQCSGEKLEFQDVGSRRVEGQFDGGIITSDGGSLLLREIEEKYHLILQFAECFGDHRDPEKTEHSVRELLAQRVMGLCQGYEDLNDHEELRKDPLLATVVGKEDPTGQDRPRQRDKGKPLAGKSTLNRLELTGQELDPLEQRYKKITANWKQIRQFFIEMFLQTSQQVGEQIVLDLDGSDDPLHGDQLGKFFHGYYDHYCYYPLFIFCGKHLLAARLRRSNIGDTEGALDELEMIVPRLQEQWPEKQILLRGDSGFSTDDLMCWCEQNGVKYVFGQGSNSRLKQEVSEQMRDAEAAYEECALPTRFYRSFSYRTLQSWSRSRRVVGKAEYLPDGPNCRFVVTNVPASQMDAQALYEGLYCGRGRAENRIKEHQTQLFSTRTSTHWMESNQMRLWLSSVAYTMMNLLREKGLAQTELEGAYPATIRERLLKVAAEVKVSVRRVALSFASSYPFQGLFRKVFRQIRRLDPRPRPRPAPA